MKIKWRVEETDDGQPYIDKGHFSPKHQYFIERNRVYGGWIVYEHVVNAHTGDFIFGTAVFVPDKNHEWKIDMEEN